VTLGIPGAPVLLTPVDGPQIANKRPTLTWLPIPNVIINTLEVSTSFTFSTKAINATVTTASYTHTADWTANKPYYWRIKATNSYGTGPYSTPCSFTTGNPPSVPSLSAPANNAVVTTLLPKFDWSNSTVPLGIAFDHYQIQVSTSNLFGSTVIDANTTVGSVTKSEYTPTISLNPATPYYWRVRAWSTAGHYSSWSLVRSVHTPYAAPVLSLPINGAVNIPLMPTFTWNAIIGATSYTLQVSKSNTFNILVINKTITASTTYTHTQPGALYYLLLARARQRSLWTSYVAVAGFHVYDWTVTISRQSASLKTGGWVFMQANSIFRSFLFPPFLCSFHLTPQSTDDHGNRATTPMAPRIRAYSAKSGPSFSYTKRFNCLNMRNSFLK
jgi:hypothetical protein